MSITSSYTQQYCLLVDFQLMRSERGPSSHSYLFFHLQSPHLQPVYSPPLDGQAHACSINMRLHWRSQSDAYPQAAPSTPYIQHCQWPHPSLLLLPSQFFSRPPLGVTFPMALINFPRLMPFHARPPNFRPPLLLLVSTIYDLALALALILLQP